MYKNRIKNDRNFFEIPASFILGMRKFRAGKFKITYIFLIFPLYFLLNFLIRKVKEREFQKNFCRSLPYFYTYPEKTDQIAYKEVIMAKVGVYI